jgi:Domain of unknown function (DUF4259)
VGAWGTGSLENDDAADWVAQLGTLAPDDLKKIFIRAADDPAYLEAAAASIAVAAAEVVAALNGAPAVGTPREIVEWTKKHPQCLSPELKEVASRALDRVRRKRTV